MTARIPAAAAIVLASVIAWAGTASAHVTISPSSLPQGTQDAILTFRVPNESPSANVVGLSIQFPLAHPIALVSPQAGSGWEVTVRKTALPKPVTTDDGTFTSTVSEIDWSGGTIPVGQFGEFNVLAQGLPTGTGELVFKAIQTYSDGTTVSWIQVPDKAVPDPAHPTPVLTLTAASSGAATAPSTAAPSGAQPSGAQPSGSAPEATTAATPSGTGASWQAVVALIFSAFAVVLGLLAVWLGRPKLGSREEQRGSSITGPPVR